ncbi:MAG: DUF418 domain-containing protein [Pseudomonadota bacterium]
MSYLQETQDTGREIFPDLARASALIGIALVNVAYFAYPFAQNLYKAGGLESTPDFAAYFTVNALFTAKSYTLFSFMFGVGFAYQIMAAERRGVGFSGRYWRRIIGLFFFAAINIMFLFQGDILFIYAVLGMLLLAFKNAKPQTLIRLAIIFYGVQILLLVSIAAFATNTPGDMEIAVQEMIESEAARTQLFADGGFVAVISARVGEWTGFIIYGLFGQGLAVMSFFLFGLAAVRNNLISHPDAPFWQKCRRIYLPIGLLISLIGAWLVVTGSTVLSARTAWGNTLIFFGSPFATAGYLGLIAKWSLTPNGPIKLFFARGGTSSLTAYLLQGLLLSLVFYEYGLGLYMQIGAAACIAIALAAALFTIAFTSLWRTVFKRGPLEAILRSWTYLGTR